MTSKKDFVEIIDFIKSYREKEDKFYLALQNISPDTEGVFLFTEYEDMLVKLLHKNLGLKKLDGTLEWWIYDTDFGKNHTEIWQDDVLVANVKTAEDLYDYIAFRGK